MSRTLADYASGRDNNFNLVRLIAALMVLVSHSFTLSTGKPEIEPFIRELGFTLGTMAVDVFFITSGFLVTGSIVARKNIVEFFLARGLRIYPGLWVAQAVTVVVVGLWFTSLDPGAFFTDRATWHYFFKNCILVRYVDFTLPGAFEHAPYGTAVNSSLWTLPVEVRMYMYLGAIWLGVYLLRKKSAQLFVAACFIVAATGFAMDLGAYAFPQLAFFKGGEGWSLTGKFFIGAALQLLKHRIGVSGRVAAGMTAVLVVSMLDPFAFGLAYRFTLPYLILYVALILPLGRFREFITGDYSYGIYIYAYPIQQALATVWKGITPGPMFLLSLVITFMFAYLSWHLIESHALTLKGRLSRWKRPLLSPRSAPSE